MSALAVAVALGRTDGRLSWSAVPSGTVVDVLSATAPDGPWSVEGSVPGDTGSIVLPWPPEDACRFLRLRCR